MNRFLFLMALPLVVSLLPCTAAAQQRLAEDNRRLEALALPFPSYSIRLIVNDTASTQQLAEINAALRKHFHFLRHKKYKKGQAACELVISVRGTVSGAMVYNSSTSSSPQTKDLYHHHSYRLDHISSADLSLRNGHQELAKIQIDSNALIQRIYEFSEAERDYSWMTDQSEAAFHRIRDVQSASNGHVKAMEIWSFEKDFLELFKNYVTRL